jgi:hypothetical protein
VLSLGSAYREPIITERHRSDLANRSLAPLQRGYGAGHRDQLDPTTAKRRKRAPADVVRGIDTQLDAAAKLALESEFGVSGTSP